MKSTEMEISAANGATLTLQEHEIARGAKRVLEQIKSLRRFHPELKVIEHFEGSPIARVRVNYRGTPTDVSIDPLDVGNRLGLRKPDAMPDHMIDPDQDPNDPWVAS